MNTVYVISGPPAVGKSTVSKIIADSLSSSALIHADQIYHMVVGGHLPPWKSDSQIVLMWDNILCLVSNFINSGVDVVVDLHIEIGFFIPLLKSVGFYAFTFHYKPIWKPGFQIE